MYHCCVHFYLIGDMNHKDDLFGTIKKMSPLEHFSHQFCEGSIPDADMAAEADAIFVDLRGMDVEGTMGSLIAAKRQDAQLVLFAEKGQVAKLSGYLDGITDIWVLPVSGEEFAFRFLRWQQSLKKDRDYRQTSHFLETAINSVPNLVWFKDKNGIHEKVNDSFCRTVNKPKEVVEGRGHAFIWDVEEDDPACIESEREVMETGRTCVSEETIQTGEGTKLLTTYKSPLYDFDGNVMGTVGVAIDITRERAFEQEIMKKTRTLEKVFTSIDCGILCHSLDGSRILSVNGAALKILGYDSREELEAAGFNMVANSVLVEDKDRLKSRMQTLEKEGDSVSTEYSVKHKNGEVLHVMGNIKLLKEDGELFYQRFLLDCTEQKKQERKNERRQMELVQALSIDFNLVCYFNLDTGTGNTLRVNECHNDMLKPIFAQVGDFDLEEKMDRYIENCVYEEDRKLLRECCSREWLAKELTEKNICYINYRTNCDGELRYFQMKAVRTGNWEKRRGAVLGFRSVDDETRSEMEKKSILEGALMQANRASKAKSIFLSNMSHDIRTPMNAIVGFTTLAINHIDSRDQVEEYLKKIMSSGNHLLSLINDVLDMSRIESGKMHLEEKPCSLPEILHGLQNIIQGDVNAKQLEFYVDTIDVFDEEIYCDKLRLNQVLLNLLSNAVKYTMTGGTISFRITEKAGAPEGFAYYEFHIRDTGIGMSEEFVAHIFEPFERERNSTISGIQGTGLGMAITKNIVDMMNGVIEVKSTLNVGTECKVSFMFRLNTEERKPVELLEFKNCHALVVDDDFNTCDSVSYMLQQIGMRAEWTLSGKEAVLRTRQALTRKDDYDVYIVDWLLPDVNGIEVVRRIRRETGGNVPVIVLTAYDWSDIEDEAREAGVSAFCSKPLFLSELRSCLNSLVNNYDSGKEYKRRAKRDHTERILLAEDNVLNQEIAVELLSEEGFQVEVADNGQMAVEMLEKSDPGYYQLVLMDVQMPVLDGYGAARKIRSFGNKELASIPIFAMTANAFEEDKQEALHNGMNGHIAKPIDVKKLISTLDRVLG
jgi:PAS domain S-box-containing protein